MSNCLLMITNKQSAPRGLNKNIYHILCLFVCVTLYACTRVCVCVHVHVHVQWVACNKPN